ncbi:SusC/RagA family TonB-linked outer membrane protein [Flavobacteriaceae bacterium F08102]|nr:SusC/RagA family TonB-linked outer membrane protein [Flavobacteriaceae bacterium F08102]
MEINLTRFLFFKKGILSNLMKIFLLLFYTSVFSFVPTNMFSQKDKIIIDSDKTISINEVFQLIKKQTDYSFIYQEDLFANSPKVTLKKGTVKISKLLNSILSQAQYNVTFNDEFTIVVTQKISTNPTDNQQRIKGKVVDNNGSPLPGVTVLIKGTSTGVETDFQGRFELAAKIGDVLSFSYVGFVTQTVKVVNTDAISIALKEDISALQEVVLVSTGYQRIEKDQMTGAVSGVTEKQYKQRESVSGDFLESLEGKIPGLVYNPQTGELTIRGVSTFDAVKKPLIVLDGFPTEIDLRTINPNDIVSVNVLRDAAAASIYGVRASNGVIVVETKRGKSGKPVFNFRSTYAFQNKPDFGYLNYADAQEVVELQRAEFEIAQPNSFLFLLGIYETNPVQQIMFGETESWASFPLLTSEEVDAQLAALGSYDNQKDYERLFYQHRETRNINFDMSGGSDKSTYILGLNFINETPVEQRSEIKQVSLNIANTFKISDRFSLDTKGTYTYSSNQSGNIPLLSDFFPYERLVDDDGVALPVKLNPQKDFFSVNDADNAAYQAQGLPDLAYYPYRELHSNTNTTKGSSVRFQARLNTKITDWLNMDIGGSYEDQNQIIDQLQLEDSYAIRTLLAASATQDPSTGQAMFTNLPAGDVLRKTNQKLTNYTVRGQLNLARKFEDGKHDFSGILGVEQRRTSVVGNLTSYFGYDGETLITKPINLGVLNARPRSPFSGFSFPNLRFNSTDYFNQTETDRRFQSYYGQGTYIFNEKYIATGSFRIDKSNLFGADPKYKNKPLWSAGVSWRMDKEDFISSMGWINQLQLRAATGFNGNIPSSNNGAFLILQSGLNTTLNTPLEYNDVLTPENQSLRWETTNNYNVGLDYGMFNRRISGSIDWYLKKTTDVFGQFDADPTTGFNNYNANTASIENRGFEVLFNSLNISKANFQWNSQITASFNKNEVLAVKASEYTNSEGVVSNSNAVKGKPIGAMYSYNYGGLNELGQPFVYDKEGNENVLAFYGNQQVDVELEDLIYNGTTTPKYVLGLNNQVTVGNFDLSVLFMYYGGHVMRVEQPDPNGVSFYANNPLKGASNFWRAPGDENTTIIPGFAPGSSVAPGYYQSYARYGYTYANRFVRKADHIRLRDVVLTYHLKPLDKHLGLRNSQLRFQAQNVFKYTFSGNDIDPNAINPNTGVRTLETQPLFSLTFSTNF